ncbi:MAG: NAD(P)-dependent oxidoreductase [Saprospiraceae bacterium]|nr:NAD(P)-dependent oxidoreductase [Saprospiraceae bacterium]
MIKEKILITGANGFIGTFLVEEALKRGLEVYAAIRKNSNISSIKDLNITFLEFDYMDVNQMSSFFTKYQFTYVIHNAGVTKSPDPGEYLRVNRDYLINVIEAIRKSGITLKKFLFVSSLAATGPADFQKNGILSQDVIPYPVTYYGKSKLEAEIYLTQQRDIPFLIIRPTAVYGPGEKDLLNVFQMINRRIELNAGFLPQHLTFIYVKDLARLMILAIFSPYKHKAYFATDGHVYTGDAFSGFIRESLNKRTFKIRLPIPVIKLVAFVSEKAAGIWDSYPPLNIDKVNEIKARNWKCDVLDLETELEFKAEYDLTKGIPETVQWYKDNKWLR